MSYFNQVIAQQANLGSYKDAIITKLYVYKIIFASFILNKMLLKLSAQANPLFWFGSDTETKTQIDRFSYRQYGVFVPSQDFIRGTFSLAMLEWPDNSAEIHLERRSRKNNICVTLILPYMEDLLCQSQVYRINTCYTYMYFISWPIPTYYPLFEHVFASG